MTDFKKDDDKKAENTGFNAPTFGKDAKKTEDVKKSEEMDKMFKDNVDKDAKDAKETKEGIKAGQSMGAGIPKNIDPNRPEISGAASVTGDMRFGGAEEDPVKKQELGKLNLEERNAMSDKHSKSAVAKGDQDKLRGVMDRKELSMSKRNRVKEILKNNGMDSMQQINAYNQLITLLEMDDSESGEMSKSKLDHQGDAKTAKDHQEVASTGKTETEKVTKH